MDILLTDYDYQKDILFFYLPENSNYEFSENINNDILIDFINKFWEKLLKKKFNELFD